MSRGIVNAGLAAAPGKAGLTRFIMTADETLATYLYSTSRRPAEYNAVRQDVSVSAAVGWCNIRDEYETKKEYFRIIILEAED